jgi:hypothetical protein
MARVAQALQRRQHVGIGLQPPVGIEQLRSDRGIDCGKPRQREIERLLCQLPEIDVAAHQRAGPGVFELLRPPHRGHGVGVGANRFRMAADGGMHVEESPVGVECVGADNHGVSHRYRS